MLIVNELDKLPIKLAPELPIVAAFTIVPVNVPVAPIVVKLPVLAEALPIGVAWIPPLICAAPLITALPDKVKLDPLTFPVTPNVDPIVTVLFTLNALTVMLPPTTALLTAKLPAPDNVAANPFPTYHLNVPFPELPALNHSAPDSTPTA